MPGGVLTITYGIEAEMARLSVPPAKPYGVPESRLWEHTCCEIFLARALPAYHEFNFAPSGSWAAYSFQQYRRGMRCIGATFDPAVSVRTFTDRMELEASIRLSVVGHEDSHRLAIAASVVIENRDGMLSYWALRHPPGKPDFHHPDSFALELDAVRH
jgi:hypothetical protein